LEAYGDRTFSFFWQLGEGSSSVVDKGWRHFLPQSQWIVFFLAVFLIESPRRAGLHFFATLGFFLVQALNAAFLRE